jgi:NAD(P)H-flavin reductase
VNLAAVIKNVHREAARAAVVRLDLGGIAFPFAAGQAVMAGLAGQPDRKPYSIACSPAQAHASGTLDLLVTIDHKGRAGRHLGDLHPGAAIELQGPLGRFTLDDVPAGSPLLLVAGGTGIAPLRSMMWAALERPDPPAITVMDSARTPEDFAFLSELRALQSGGRIRLRLTVTRGAGPEWTGGRHRIDRRMLADLIDPSVVCLVCGPDSLVAEVPAMLRELGVPADRVRKEEY